MRKRKLLVTLAAGLALVGVGAIVLWPREDRLTRANFLRAMEGRHTRAELEEILGPGTSISIPGQLPGECWVKWENERGDLEVNFDASGKKTESMGEIFANPIEHDGPFDGLIRRAKRQWRKWFP